MALFLNLMVDLIWVSELKFSLLAKCRTGDGKISASGGNGLAGGGGGRISIDVFSRHDDVEFLVHGEFELVLLFPNTQFQPHYSYHQSLIQSDMGLSS